MAYIECTVKSKLLATSVKISLYFPSDRTANEGNRVCGVLTLLHSYGGCGADWFHYTSAARYAGENQLIIIAPDCANSFYQNMVYGGAYHTFLLEEMPVLLSDIFKLPTGREHQFIAGFSMGGYGALHLGMTRPDRYSACASFSGAVDLGMMLKHKQAKGLREVFAPIFGDELLMPPVCDLHKAAQTMVLLPAEKQPRVLLTNGLQDHEPYQIVAQNNALHNTMHALRPAHYRRLQWNGVHDWAVCDRSLVYAIDYFLQNGYAERKLSDWRSAAVTQE